VGVVVFFFFFFFFGVFFFFVFFFFLVCFIFLFLFWLLGCVFWFFVCLALFAIYRPLPLVLGAVLGDSHRRNVSPYSSSQKNLSALLLPLVLNVTLSLQSEPSKYSRTTLPFWFCLRRQQISFPPTGSKAANRSLLLILFVLGAYRAKIMVPSCLFPKAESVISRKVNKARAKRNLIVPLFQSPRRPFFSSCHPIRVFAPLNAQTRRGFLKKSRFLRPPTSNNLPLPQRFFCGFFHLFPFPLFYFQPFFFSR